MNDTVLLKEESASNFHHPAPFEVSVFDLFRVCRMMMISTYLNPSFRFCFLSNIEMQARNGVMEGSN
ncbi:MAG: hypothetical protein WD016_04180 [Balneolaceae bacterium]